MTVDIGNTTGVFVNDKDLDQVYENSLRLQNKIDQSDTTTQKTIERANELINDVGNNTVNSTMTSSSHSLKRKNKLSFKKSCKCQYGKKCKCGDNCQCSHEIQTQLDEQFNNEFINGNNNDLKRSTWYKPWGNGKNKQKDKITKSQSLRDTKRTILNGELSPNSPGDKEMLEIFSDNETHSIQDKLVFPHSPIVNSDNENKEQIQNAKNESNVMLSEPQRRESLVSSDDYSMIKLQNTKKYDKLKSKDDECVCSNKEEDKKEEEEETDISNKECICPIKKDKEKKRFFDKLWDKFHFKSSKVDNESFDKKGNDQESVGLGEMNEVKIGSSKDMINEDVIITPSDERETNGSIKGQYNNDNHNNNSHEDDNFSEYDNLTTRSKPFTL